MSSQVGRGPVGVGRSGSDPIEIGRRGLVTLCVVKPQDGFKDMSRPLHQDGRQPFLWPWHAKKTSSSLGAFLLAPSSTLIPPLTLESGNPPTAGFTRLSTGSGLGERGRGPGPSADLLRQRRAMGGGSSGRSRSRRVTVTNPSIHSTRYATRSGNTSVPWMAWWKTTLNYFPLRTGCFPLPCS